MSREVNKLLGDFAAVLEKQKCTLLTLDAELQEIQAALSTSTLGGSGAFTGTGSPIIIHPKDIAQCPPTAVPLVMTEVLKQLGKQGGKGARYSIVSPKSPVSSARRRMALRRAWRSTGGSDAGLKKATGFRERRLSREAVGGSAGGKKRGESAKRGQASWDIDQKMREAEDMQILNKAEAKRHVEVMPRLQRSVSALSDHSPPRGHSRSPSRDAADFSSLRASHSHVDPTVSPELGPSNAVPPSAAAATWEEERPLPLTQEERRRRHSPQSLSSESYNPQQHQQQQDRFGDLHSQPQHDTNETSQKSQPLAPSAANKSTFIISAQLHKKLRDAASPERRRGWNSSTAVPPIFGMPPPPPHVQGGKALVTAAAVGRVPSGSAHPPVRRMSGVFVSTSNSAAAAVVVAPVPATKSPQKLVDLRRNQRMTSEELKLLEKFTKKVSHQQQQQAQVPPAQQHQQQNFWNWLRHGKV